MVKITDIVFWLLILAVIGIALWMLFGSPTLEVGLVSISLFVAGSEILLWRALFSVDKRTAIGFEKVKFGFERVDNRLKNIEKDVNEIKRNIIGINKKLKIK